MAQVRDRQSIVTNGETTNGFKVVGQSTKRVDALEKVTGARAVRCRRVAHRGCCGASSSAAHTRTRSSRRLIPARPSSCPGSWR